ncbi:DUF3631 domain-containing protein [Bradyrhizobium sp. CB82]|uniref:DUF3631 domain-containing protein n=1 Tax=Bradyrhizobium sp. CB82 TaxID=3039159 RepID=UPI0024B08CE3|nr:DUF3631 domain-containing protein [Bradyrhizobium sp. CB82]WFU37599.1 DUF3631 domain-containing protein [Bradyrhizobium sp. CB82]
MAEHGIIEFPSPRPFDEEKLRRIQVEAERLASLSELDRAFQLSQPLRAEALGTTSAILKTAVKAIIDERAKREAAEERKKKQLAKEKAQAAKEAERVKRQAEKQAEQEKRRAEKESAHKSKEKIMGFATLARLPVARQAKELGRLAERLGEDVAVLRKECEDFLGIEGGEEAPSETEPWPEPVDVAVLLSEFCDKISRYVALQPHQLTAAVLWTAHCWCYDHGVPIHSPLLAATSAEPDSGKSTLIAVIGRAVPRFSLNVEITGPSLYRHVDRVKPTIMIDEADDLFVRRSDLKHIINAGWTRGAKIPRQVCINGVWETVYFDPYTPKGIALLGRNLPQATRTRCIELRMRPKRADEKKERFHQVDDVEFAMSRRKFARWAADDAAALKDAKPSMLPGLNNRAAMNWHLLLAIAELAGGPWPERAREAAERLTHTGRRPSDNVQLLSAFREIFADGRKTFVTSEEIVAYLRCDPTSIWAEYNHGGKITQRQVAFLLDAFDIHPKPLHPTGRKDFGRMGYEATQFVDAFARYLPDDPIIQSPDKKPGKKRNNSKSLKRPKRR